MLDIALRLEKPLLQKEPGVEVVLTRRTDEFVPLEERTAIANRQAADLFLSIHANASSGAQARGVETYFLNFATSHNASRRRRPRERGVGTGDERAARLRAGHRAQQQAGRVARFRDAWSSDRSSSHLRAPNKESSDLGVKQAPFVVLIGAAMPSVLAEVSFVTNDREARLLKRTELPAADCGSAVRRRAEVPGVALDA